MVHGALQRLEVAGGIDARGFEHQRAGHPQRRVSRRVHAVMRDRLFEGAAGIRQGVAAQRGQLATALAECVIRIESRMCGEGVVACSTLSASHRGFRDPAEHRGRGNITGRTRSREPGNPIACPASISRPAGSKRRTRTAHRRCV
jgi:hypothetical protein